MNATDELLDELAEKKRGLRLEWNHGDMKWYAYYAGREQRSLFDDDRDWITGADTPFGAIQNLNRYLGENI